MISYTVRFLLYILLTLVINMYSVFSNDQCPHCKIELTAGSEGSVCSSCGYTEANTNEHAVRQDMHEYISQNLITPLMSYLQELIQQGHHLSETDKEKLKQIIVNLENIEYDKDLTSSHNELLTKFQNIAGIFNRKALQENSNFQYHTTDQVIMLKMSLRIIESFSPITEHNTNIFLSLPAFSQSVSNILIGDSTSHEQYLAQIITVISIYLSNKYGDDHHINMKYINTGLKKILNNLFKQYNKLTSLNNLFNSILITKLKENTIKILSQEFNQQIQEIKETLRTINHVLINLKNKKTNSTGIIISQPNSEIEAYYATVIGLQGYFEFNDIEYFLQSIESILDSQASYSERFIDSTSRLINRIGNTFPENTERNTIFAILGLATILGCGLLQQ